MKNSDEEQEVGSRMATRLGRMDDTKLVELLVQTASCGVVCLGEDESPWMRIYDDLIVHGCRKHLADVIAAELGGRK